MKSIGNLLVSLVLLALTAAHESAAPADAGESLEPGVWSVGFQVLAGQYINRPFGDGALRPLQIAVWYRLSPSWTLS